jgi:hypothetical protein
LGSLLLTSVLSISLFGLSGTLLSSPAAGNIIYASPTGSDSNVGTLSSPVQTLIKARDLARVAKASSGGSAEVHLTAGNYYLNSSLDLGASDNNTIWKAKDIGTVKISGGTVLGTNWQSLGNNLYKQSIPQINNYPRQLYVNGNKTVE